MRPALAAFALAAALAGCATPYAPQDFDFSSLTSSELIEGMRARELRALGDAFVHEINPTPALSAGCGCNGESRF
jgi:hypothetical protein